MKCLKHLISFLLYLNLLSLCSTTRSPFNRTRRWYILKSSVIAIEKHCFNPLKTLTLAPKKIAFVQGFFRPLSILIFSFPHTYFTFAPHLLRRWAVLGVPLVGKRGEYCPLFLSSKVGRNLSPLGSFPLSHLSMVWICPQPALCSCNNVEQRSCFFVAFELRFALHLLHPKNGIVAVGINNFALFFVLFDKS